MNDEQRAKPKKADGTLRDHGKGQNTEFPPLMGRRQNRQRVRRKTSKIIQC